MRAVAVAGDGSAEQAVSVRDRERGTVVTTWVLGSTVRGLAWHPDGKRLAAAASDFNVYLCDLDTRTP